MSHIEGDCVEPLFDGGEPGPDVTQRYRSACRAMSALHSISPSDLGLGGEPVVDPLAEVHRWCDTLQTVDAALVPGWQDVRDALLGCAPTPMGPGVVHGDFRLGNLLAVGSRITAVIDWEI
jgi:aminoglycoside phosphotransferase (APT) family kinase protein